MCIYPTEARFERKPLLSGTRPKQKKEKKTKQSLYQNNKPLRFKSTPFASKAQQIHKTKRLSA